MENSAVILWWVLCGVAVGLELLTGTFYLLLLALGFFAAAIAAHLGFGTGTQMTLAAIVGIGLMTAWHLWRQQQGPRPAVNRNPDVLLDVGSRVEVTHWSELATTQVMYRGVNWSARMVNPDALTQAQSLQTGVHQIVSVQGNVLLLEKV